MAKKCVVLVGSLRKESFSKKVAVALSEFSPNLELELLDLQPLTMYNQDLDDSPPESWSNLRGRIKAADAVLFVTPEYNRSVPGVLKNAIDIASRPYGQNVFDKKPAGIISVTPGHLGAFGANHHLRQSLVFLNTFTMSQPEAYLSDITKAFDEKNHFTQQKTKDFLQAYMGAFELWIQQFDHQK